VSFAILPRKSARRQERRIGVFDLIDGGTIRGCAIRRSTPTRRSCSNNCTLRQVRTVRPWPIVHDRRALLSIMAEGEDRERQPVHETGKLMYAQSNGSPATAGAAVRQSS
jgi:hypothetical protein